MKESTSLDYDYIIIGSGFGGSVSALRLSEKGYKVLVIEKGKWLKANDFPKTNWNLKKWLWLPQLKFHGLFKMTFFRHVAVLSGVGVGGGSLVYANTLPVPKEEFFKSESWSHLADWQKELEPFYPLALKMLGAEQNPRLQVGDLALRSLAREMGKEDKFQPTNVAVYFGESGVTKPDPYFDGRGPKRTGCIFCGGCMLGCRYNSKNTLDKNYLHLAQQNGVTIQAESEVYDVVPINHQNGKIGYRVSWKTSTKYLKKRGSFTAKGVIYSGGVMGTVRLLLKLRESSLPELSDRVGHDIRTNSESLIGVTTFDKRTDFSKGIAIGSILHTDEHSHLEPVRYSAGSGAWRLLMSPLAFGKNIWTRLGQLIWDIARHPIKNLRIWWVDDWSKRTQIMLFMQSLNSTLRLKTGTFGIKSELDKGTAPTSFIPEAKALSEQYARIVDGKPTVLLTETLAGIPTTAHILGGCVMGENREEGVIDKDNHVFGYENMLVCDGSMISANPGVNPSLTITALSERAMSKIPRKSG